MGVISKAPTCHLYAECEHGRRSAERRRCRPAGSVRPAALPALQPPFPRPPPRGRPDARPAPGCARPGRAPCASCASDAHARTAPHRPARRTGWRGGHRLSPTGMLRKLAEVKIDERDLRRRGRRRFRPSVRRCPADAHRLGGDMAGHRHRARRDGRGAVGVSERVKRGGHRLRATSGRGGSGGTPAAREEMFRRSTPRSRWTTTQHGDRACLFRSAQAEVQGPCGPRNGLLLARRRGAHRVRRSTELLFPTPSSLRARCWRRSDHLTAAERRELQRAHRGGAVARGADGLLDSCRACRAGTSARRISRPSRPCSSCAGVRRRAGVRLRVGPAAARQDRDGPRGARVVAFAAPGRRPGLRELCGELRGVQDLRARDFATSQG